MSNPDDRYAGLTPEERAFREGFDAEDPGLPIATAATPAPEPAPISDDGGTPAGDGTEGGVDTGESAADPAPQDPLEALPEELRNRWTELESANRNYQSELERERAERARIQNDYAAVAGRLKPLQQKLAELERAPAQAAPAVQPSQGQPADAAALFESDDWKHYEATFPEEAKALRGTMTGVIQVTEAKLQQQIAHLEQRVSSIAPLVEQIAVREQETEYERALKVLTDPHPDYKEIDASPEFRDWLARDYPRTLPAMMRAQYADPQFRKELFADPASVSDIMTQFKSTRQPAPAAPTPEPAPAPSAPAAPARTVDPRLALSAAPSVPTGGVRKPRLTDMTPEQQFRAGYEAG